MRSSTRGSQRPDSACLILELIVDLCDVVVVVESSVLRRESWRIRAGR